MLGFLTDIFVAKKIELLEHFVLNPHSFFSSDITFEIMLEETLCVGSHLSP